MLVEDWKDIKHNDYDPPKINKQIKKQQQKKKHPVENHLIYKVLL